MVGRRDRCAGGGASPRRPPESTPLAAFHERWHPIIREGLTFLRDEPADPAFADRAARHRAAGSFAHAVIESALGL